MMRITLRRQIALSWRLLTFRGDDDESIEQLADLQRHRLALRVLNELGCPDCEVGNGITVYRDSSGAPWVDIDHADTCPSWRALQHEAAD